VSARWVTWIGDEAATVELVERSEGHVVARLETATGVRTVSCEIPLRRLNGERLLRLDGRAIAAWVGPEIRGERAVTVGGRDMAVRVKREVEVWLGSGDETAGSGAVVAAMPGRIVKVLVQVGDSVEQGQPVLIIEAMKMENEVKARRAGVVQSVHVVTGDSVEGGMLLLEVG